MRMVGMLAAIIALGWLGVTADPPERLQPPGQTAPRIPAQYDIDTAAPIVSGNYTLHPRARFEITARVLARARYRFDSLATLVPVDIAFGWAEMSDTELIKQLSISQSGRWYYWSYSKTPVYAGRPVHERVISEASANMHLIPASPEIEAILLAAQVGDIMALSGDLVDVTMGATNGWRMPTSLRREDTGGGACEIIYVRAAIINGPVRHKTGTSFPFPGTSAID
jgi:hypothetical protein